MYPSILPLLGLSLLQFHSATEEKTVVGHEKRSQVHKPEDMVIEAMKNGSPVEKEEDIATEDTATDSLITTESGKSETKGKEVVGEENESSVEKPDDMVVDSIVAEKMGKSEAERNEGKNESPIVSKPSKRRITPMAIDP